MMGPALGSAPVAAAHAAGAPSGGGSSACRVGLLSVAQFGAGPGVPAGTDAAAIQKADSAASQRGQVLYFPPGYYEVDTTVVETARWVGAGVASSAIALSSDLTGRRAAVVVRPGAAVAATVPALSDLSVLGPGHYALGAAPDGSDGLDVVRPTMLQHVAVHGFYAGIVLDSPGGGARLDDVDAEHNYFGLEFARDGVGTTVSDSNLTGASFASVAAGPGATIRNLTMVRTQLGFSPFGFYQPAPAVGGGGGMWISGLHLGDTRFEQIGNAAFYSAAAATGGGGVADLVIQNPGWSSGPAFRLPGQGSAYTMVFGPASGRNSIFDVSLPFEPGPSGLLSVYSNTGTWDVWHQMYGAPTVSVGHGPGLELFRFYGQQAADRRGWSFIPAGRLFATVRLPDYVGPAATLRPVLQLQSDGGSARPTVGVSGIRSSPGAPTSFEVSAATLATSPIIFNWRVTGKPPLADVSSAYPPPVGPVICGATVADGTGIVNVADFGARGDGTTDDTAAITRAEDYAETIGNGAEVYFPPGVYRVAGGITVRTIWIGAGPSLSVLKLATPLATTKAGTPGSPLLTLAARRSGQSWRSVAVRHMGLEGPGLRSSVQMSAGATGIYLDGGYGGAGGSQVRLDDDAVTGFDIGVVMDTALGHDTLSGVRAGSNYYGVYDLNGSCTTVSTCVDGGDDGGDNYILGSDLSANRFAAFASPSTTLVDGLRIEHSRLGSSPYGIYQEAPASSASFPAPAWLVEAQIVDSDFSQTGNGALWSDSITYGGDLALVKDLRFTGNRFSWSAADGLTGRPAVAVLSVGTAQGDEVVEEVKGAGLSPGRTAQVPVPGGQPITVDGAAIWTALQNATWDWVHDSTTPAIGAAYSTGDGQWVTGTTDPSATGGAGRIPAGHSEVVVRTAYLGPASSVFPFVASASGVPLLVTQVSSDPRNGTAFVVASPGGGQGPAAFTWSTY